MSFLLFNKTSTPNAPASAKGAIFEDTADRRLKMVDDLGVVNTLHDNAGNPGRNRIINGSFAIWQRAGVPLALANVASPSATARVYAGADHWGHTVGNTTTPQHACIDTSGAAVTGLNTRYYGQFKQLTNAAKLCLSQPIESIHGMDLRGRVVRFQAKLWFTTALTPAVRLGVLAFVGTADADTRTSFITAFNGAGVDPTWGTNLSLIPITSAQQAGVSVAVGTTGSSAAFTLTNAPTLCSIMLTIPTTATNIIPVIYTDNTMAVNDILDISEVALYQGQSVLDWAEPPYVDQLAKCRRYYQKSFAVNTAPAQNVGINTGEFKFAATQAGATTNAGTMEFPVTMKTAPTLTFYNPAASNAQVRDEVAGADCSATGLPTNVTTDINSIAVKTTGAAGTALGGILGVHWATTTDAEF